MLPLRGKILNVERARFDKMLGSEQIGTLITALGAGIGRDDFNLEKLRYHKIIIMTDADVDGSHIRTLLLTFFFRQMRPIIEAGHLFIAQPPLFKVKRGQSEQYLKDERALEDYLVEAGLDGATLTLASGEVRAGADLRALIEEARAMRRLLDGLHSRYNRSVVEQAALAGRVEAARRPCRSGGRAARRRDRRAHERDRGRDRARLDRPARGGRLCADSRGARRAAGSDPRRRPARFGRCAPPRRARAAAPRGLRRTGDASRAAARRQPSPAPRSFSRRSTPPAARA